MCGPLHWLWGLALALRPAVETIFYAECNMACKAVLVARMNNNDLDTTPICPDVKQLPMKTLVDAKPGMLVAGFPCQDVSTGGKQAGMKGQRSSLVRYVIKAAADLRPLHVLLENVYAIMGVKMRKMLLFIVSQLYRLGYNVSWVCIAAVHAGMHTRRMRWFCLATRSDVPFPRPFFLPEIGQQEQTELAKHKAEWPPADQWLTNRMSDADHSRMKMLGNIVVPQQAQLAMRILGSAHMS